MKSQWEVKHSNVEVIIRKLDSMCGLLRRKL